MYSSARSFIGEADVLEPNTGHSGLSMEYFECFLLFISVNVFPVQVSIGGGEGKSDESPAGGHSSTLKQHNS